MQIIVIVWIFQSSAVSCKKRRKQLDFYSFFDFKQNSHSVLWAFTRTSVEFIS